jgi:hypothetical protein
MKRKLGRVLGTRLLHTRGSRRRMVTVRLGVPRRQGSEEWFCPIQVSGLGNPRIQYVYGEDAIQSVELALQAVRIALEKSRSRLRAVLRPATERRFS